jgi:hypothetical protein
MHAREGKDDLSLRIIVNERVSWLRFLNVSKSWDQPLLRGGGAYCTEGLPKAIRITCHISLRIAKYQVVTCRPHIPHLHQQQIAPGCENKPPQFRTHTLNSMRKRRKTTRSNHYAAVSRVLNYLLTRAEYLSQQEGHS